MSPVAGGGPARRGGFTLLELIVVVALLVALGGLALPGLLARVGGSTEDAVRTRLLAAAAVCRAEAQRSGVAVEMAAREVGGRTIVVSRAAVVDEDVGVGEGEVLLELPAGYRVSVRESGVEEADGEVSLSGADVVIAAFQPDGSAGVPGDAFLVHGSAAMEFRFARWTGAMTLREVVDEDEGSAAAAGSGAGGGSSSPSSSGARTEGAR